MLRARWWPILALGGVRSLAMKAAGPRQLRITDALTKSFAPTVLEVLNESHGRHEDESHFKVVVVSEVAPQRWKSLKSVLSPTQNVCRRSTASSRSSSATAW